MRTDAMMDLFTVSTTKGTPKTKRAATEAIEHVPEHVILISAHNSEKQGRMIDLIEAGRTVGFTDGEGNYYGTITRGMGEDLVFIVDYQRGK